MKKLLLLLLILSLVAAAAAQSKNKKNPRPVSSSAVPQATPDATPTPEMQTPPQEKIPQKKNAREDAPEKTPIVDNSKIVDSKIYYRYEFTQPDYLIKKMLIEHDETGRAKITFAEKNFDDSVTENVQISAVSLEKIKKLFDTLNFLESTESYQSTVRNYPHLGTKKILFRNDGKERAIEYNWTENADAKALGEEYARIGYQLVWESDIKAARVNQPLETPSLVDVLDSYLRRGEISDPPQLLPFMKELSNDERLPLIARNHILRLMKEIEKNANEKK